MHYIYVCTNLQNGLMNIMFILLMCISNLPFIDTSPSRADNCVNNLSKSAATPQARRNDDHVYGIRRTACSTIDVHKHHASRRIKNRITVYKGSKTDIVLRVPMTDTPAVSMYRECFPKLTRTSLY